MSGQHYVEPIVRPSSCRSWHSRQLNYLPTPMLCGTSCTQAIPKKPTAPMSPPQATRSQPFKARIRRLSTASTVRPRAPIAPPSTKAWRLDTTNCLHIRRQTTHRQLHCSTPLDTAVSASFRPVMPSPFLPSMPYWESSMPSPSTRPWDTRQCQSWPAQQTRYTRTPSRSVLVLRHLETSKTGR